MPTKEKNDHEVNGAAIGASPSAELGGTCCICGLDFSEWGNNPEPIKSFEEGQCCNWCNEKYVIPTRIRNLFEPRA